MNFSFKIFGAPHIFDLYQGNENDINYFQTFDNGNKENEKLTIHRMASGQVSYSYLRYNFISGGGRSGSFFGMAIVFNAEYCADVENLYKLFDSVYKTILQNKSLIEDIKGNPSAQAKYLVETFKEAENEVKRVENVVIKNLHNAFSEDVYPLDSSFKQGKSNLTIKLNSGKGNSAFLAALREHAWVSISPEYKDDEINLSLETIAMLDNKITKEQKNIANISINALKGKDVQKEIEVAYKWIKNEKTLIQSYLKLQPELSSIYGRIDDIHTQLNDLKIALEGKIGLPKQISNANPKKKQIISINKTESNRDGNSKRVIVNKKRIKLILGIAGVFGLILLLYFLYPKENVNPYEGDYAKPTTRHEEVNNSELLNNSNDIIDSLLSLAMKEYEKEYDKEIDKYFKIKTILEQTKKYDYNPDVIIEDYRQKTIKYYQNLIQKAVAIENKKKYAEYIIQIDPNNALALEIFNKQDLLPVESKIAADSDTNTIAKTSRTDCLISHKYDTSDLKGQWTTSELLKKAAKSLNAGSYQVVIDACNAILEFQKQKPDCATKEQLNKANSLLRQANSLK